MVGSDLNFSNLFSRTVRIAYAAFSLHAYPQKKAGAAMLPRLFFTYFGMFRI